jgi:putative two-component system response regulator
MPPVGSSNARILIVDDVESNVRLLERILRRGGYEQLETATDPRRVLPLFIEWQPDLLLLDLMMPHLDGFAVMDVLRPLVPPGQPFPILVLTSDATPEAKRRALASGASDFVMKPFDVVEVLLRIKHLLESRELHAQLQRQNSVLEDKVRERTRDLEHAHLETLERLALAAEYRDDLTDQHARRVGQLAACLARALGWSPELCELIHRAAILHDVGKIGIPDRVLLKPAPLTAEEWEIVKAHTTIGAKILSDGATPLIQMAEVIAHTHHEHWDWRGYPRGLAGGTIPISGRIVAVADAFDAMTTARPYRAALDIAAAIEEIRRHSGTAFDPAIVAVLPSLVDAAAVATADTARSRRA